MKIEGYKILINEKGEHNLFAIVKEGDDEDEFVRVGSIPGASMLNSTEIEKEAKTLLAQHGFEIVDKKASHFDDKGYVINQKEDLNYIRTQMRKVLKNLADPNVKLSEKKEMLPIYQTMCQSSQMITNACKLELQIEKILK